jgi:hypothetical protein
MLTVTRGDLTRLAPLEMPGLANDVFRWPTETPQTRWLERFPTGIPRTKRDYAVYGGTDCYRENKSLTSMYAGENG